jgi:hypothetical protein
LSGLVQFGEYFQVLGRFRSAGKGVVWVVSVVSARRYQVLARIGEEVLGEFLVGILIGFLGPVLDDS